MLKINFSIISRIVTCIITGKMIPSTKRKTYNVQKEQKKDKKKEKKKDEKNEKKKDKKKKIQIRSTKVKP